MHPDRDFPRSTIDTASFADALGAGALDACLSYLRQNDDRQALRADWNVRLAEALFHGNRRDDALECGRRAFAVAGDNQHLLHVCAWLFSNSGCHGEAARAYRRLIALRPDWVEGYRHASGSSAACGDVATAIDCGMAASDLAPDNAEFAAHAGRLLAQAGHWGDAARYLDRARAAAPQDGAILRDLSQALFALGRQDEAVTAACEAAAAAPHDSGAAIHAGELLLRCDRIDEAAVLLREAAAADPRAAALWRVLSSAEMVRGDIGAALAAIARAIGLRPDSAEYHLHRGYLLLRLGVLGDADDAIARAEALDGADPEVRRARVAWCLAAGRVTEATARGGALLREFPRDDAAAAMMAQVLSRRLDTIDGDYVVVADRRPRPKRQKPAPRLLDALRRQARVVNALILRETRTRFGESKLGYGWALLEPILHIALLSAVFSLLMHGQPPIGTQFFIFYYTGIIPYHMFIHSSTAMTYAISDNRPLLQLPLVSVCDVVLARGLLEIATDIVVAVLLLAGFQAAGLAALPDDLWGPASALLVTALLGCGMGFVNAVLNVFCRAWDKIWAQATRALYFCSGIFYVPGMMPDWARDILVWNPLLHAVDWFRAGFFAVYQPHWLDRGFLAGLAIAALLGGLVLERGLRRRLSRAL